MSRPPLEVADLIRTAGAAFVERNRQWLSWKHIKVLLAIARCRVPPHLAVISINAPAAGIVCRALPHNLGAPSHHTFPQLNLHKARVRRNHGRLPSNGFIERAPEHPARAHFFPESASDKALTSSNKNGEGLLLQLKSAGDFLRAVEWTASRPSYG